MKSEPNVYSFDDLLKDGRTMWDSIRNYQARNFMRDDMKIGDQVLFYHSNAKPPGVAGIAEVVSEPYPDPVQFDPASNYHDPKSDPDNPRWILVDVKPVEALPRFVSLEELRGAKSLSEMPLLQRGQRLSIQPVTAAQFRAVRKMASKKPAAQISNKQVALTNDDFLDFFQDMSTGASNRSTKAFGDVHSTTAEQLLPIFDQLKLEPTNGCLSLIDMPKEEKSFFELPELFKDEAG